MHCKGIYQIIETGELVEFYALALATKAILIHFKDGLVGDVGRNTCPDVWCEQEHAPFNGLISIYML